MEISLENLYVYWGLKGYNKRLISWMSVVLNGTVAYSYTF